VTNSRKSSHTILHRTLSQSREDDSEGHFAREPGSLHVVVLYTDARMSKVGISFLVGL
jgi:hypothetical protein